MGGVIKIKSPHRKCIEIGFQYIGCVDPKSDRAMWQNNGEIIVHRDVRLGSGTKLVNGGLLELGANFGTSASTTIICYDSMKFGDDCMISWDCLFVDTDLHPIKDESNEIINQNRPVEIGNHVWIGTRSTILKGSKIPDNVVVVAGSVVSGNVGKENTIITGN